MKTKDVDSLPVCPRCGSRMIPSEIGRRYLCPNEHDKRHEPHPVGCCCNACVPHYNAPRLVSARPHVADAKGERCTACGIPLAGIKAVPADLAGCPAGRTTIDTTTTLEQLATLAPRVGQDVDVQSDAAEIIAAAYSVLEAQLEWAKPDCPECAGDSYLRCGQDCKTQKYPSETHVGPAANDEAIVRGHMRRNVEGLPLSHALQGASKRVEDALLAVARSAAELLVTADEHGPDLDADDRALVTLSAKLLRELRDACAECAEAAADFLQAVRS